MNVVVQAEVLKFAHNLIQNIWSLTFEMQIVSALATDS